MAETIEKLRPDRDLQCFFFEPSAIAAMSGSSADGFTVSGTWRQQFDWAVIEWNRDNTHEHPAFRYLPDGDLSGLVLSYEETRTNCIPMDSSLFATVDWPSLRVWVEGVAEPYLVSLLDHATPIEGSSEHATADFTLSGTLADGDVVGLAYLADHFTYPVVGTHIVEDAVEAIVEAINTTSVLTATRDGATAHITYTGLSGANGNRFGMYSYSTGSATWDSAAKQFSGGTSPTKWSVTIDFGSLPMATNKIRKMRWTYAADLQAASYERSEFEVVVSNWAVTGTNRTYSVAGPGSRRIEDNETALITYGAGWATQRGNFSGGTIHFTTTEGASVSCTYQATQTHTLYLGTRYLGTTTHQGATISITVDGDTFDPLSLLIDQEDVLIRLRVGEYGSGSHTITVTHAGPDGNDFFFDFLELASPTTDLPVFPTDPRMTLASDWDTEHSLAVAPERTAWFINSLGFVGRQNHFVGALWFYELVRTGTAYASGTVTFEGTVVPDDTASVTLSRSGVDTTLTKLIHAGDTLDTLATAFAQELNIGYTAVWASASGSVLTITSRSMGLDGEAITLTSPSGAHLTPVVTGFAGGNDGDWRTDLTASPRLNRAVRDWSLSFFTALQGYGIDTAAAFSMEIGNGDPSVDVGIAQRGPDGDAITLPTPSLQTNFSPASLAFWKECYLEMAGIQAAAGLQPYLQFGEVQWWYFPNDGLTVTFSGMPFYDAWNLSQFEAAYGHALAVITTNTVDPASYPDEVAFLPVVIGNFTDAIMSFVRDTYSTCRFEVLYPTDVNQTSFNQAINYPTASWTPAALTCLKTESFGFTLKRDLDKSEGTTDFGTFPAAQRSHLVGIGDSTTAWVKEAQIAEGKRFESVVLFALDQFCLIGYGVPLPASLRRSLRMGS